MSSVKKQTINKTSNGSKNLSRQISSVDIQNKSLQIKHSKSDKQKEILKKQLKLVKNKEIRAVPGGYYTGLINDMHKDYKNFQEKRTFLQIEYLNPLIQEIKQTTSSIDRLNDEKKLDKFHAPITLNSLSIQCTLPFEYNKLENLSPLLFLIKYTKPSINRQQIILKIIRKIQHDTIIDIIQAKDIIFEYFNHYKTYKQIDELFDFLNIQLTDTFQVQDIIIICCYSERYFLHKLEDEKENIIFQRSLQEIIDFEFLKRKFDNLKLNESLLKLIKTLETPEKKEKQ